MVAEPTWLPLEAVVDAHAATIGAHGGTPGLRDRGLLESALARPRQRFHYSADPPTIQSLAAAYGWGLCRNHAFIDGNKRIGLIAAFVFLDLNGYDLDAREDEAHQAFLSVASGDLSEAELTAWVEEAAVKRD